MGDCQPLTLRPFNGHLVADLLQFGKRLETIGWILQYPLTISSLFHIHGQIEDGAQLFNIPGLFFFETQVAPGLQTLTINLRHDVFHTLTRLEIMPTLVQGFDKHLKAKAAAIGQQVHVDGGIGFFEDDITRHIS